MQEIYGIILNGIADQNLLVPVTGTHDLALWNTDKITGYDFYTDASYVDIASVHVENKCPSSVAEAVTKERLHSSGEDYLKAIFILEAQHGSVRSVEVAEYMNVSKASVNHAVRHTRNQAH